MELYTMNRQFLKQDVIDGFHSVIWTERYYGDSEVELVVPATQDMIKKLPEGVFLGLAGSDEPMILETASNEDGELKLAGISLLSWMNNRFIRTSAPHEDQYFYVGGWGTPGWTLWALLWYMTSSASPYLNGTNPIGIANPQQFAIPGMQVRAWDTSGDPLYAAVPFGPLYDAMREIATTFEIGMQITVDDVTNTGYSLYFRSYKGIDRTSRQSTYPVVRFSPLMDSLADIKELRSIAKQKTIVFAFASNLDPAENLTTVPGTAALSGTTPTGFDLRAMQIFPTDITTDQIGGDQNVLVSLLNSRARDALNNNSFIRTIDGEIVPANQFQYGVNYNLGDLIEVQGNSGVTQISRVTEYIRAQDASGERAYPTVAALG